MNNCLQTKVAIVGAGFVGSTIAYAFMLQGVAQEIVLIDTKREKAEGEALDLDHGMQFAHAKRVVGTSDMSYVKDASVVIITAGVAQKPGQSRSDLLTTNVGIFKELIPSITKHNKDCIILVVTNPLDVLTYVTLKLSGLPSCAVFGAGTVLDTARLRYLLGLHCNISPKDITASVLGEHGDSEFVWWSKACVAGIPIQEMTTITSAVKREIHEQTKNAAYEIISKKGATYYSIALVVAKIVRAILLDQSRVFTVSTMIEDLYGVNDVCLSIPTVVRGGGTCQRLPLTLDDQEQSFFKSSAAKVYADIVLAKKLLDL